MVRTARTARTAQASKDDDDKEDISVLRTPIQLHGKPMEQIINSIHYGTPELRRLLMDECDVIFECKVCRALFRDQANFMSHKRRYCTKSILDDNHFTIAQMPDEKVYVIQPEEPDSSKSIEVQIKPRGKPTLEETVARIQSGELGHSHAFNVYTEAVNKLQRQKEEMKVATIRTRPIPTNPNAVFMDVNMASVNIHERHTTMQASSSNVDSACNIPFKSRKARSRMNGNKDMGLVRKDRSRILRKDCKNSEELQKLLLKELKEIQIKVKHKNENSGRSRSLSAQREVPTQKSIPSPVKTAVVMDVAKPKQKSESNETSRLMSAKKEAPKLRNDMVQNDTLSSVKTEALMDVAKQRRKIENDDTPKPVSAKKEVLRLRKDVAEKCTPSSVKTYASINVAKQSAAVNLRGSDKQGSNHTMIKSELTSSRCDKSTRQGRNAVIDKKSQQTLICQKCYSIFSSKQSLSFHNKMIHSENKTFYPCLYCSCVFYYFPSVNRHLRLSHSKTKAEVKSLHKQLKAKAFTKTLSQADEPQTQQVSKGSRKSLRHKQEAFSSQTSPSSSYVLHSVKKLGKKLSAKKDALSTSYIEEKSIDTDGEDKRNTDVSSESKFDSEITTAIKETENASKSCSDSAQKTSSLESSRHRSQANELKRLTLNLKQSFPRQTVLHTCKKCRRVFGRMLTLTNHLKVCQGRTATLSQGRTGRRGKPRKGFPVQARVSTRSGKTKRSQSLTTVSRRTPNILQESTSNRNSRSSNTETVKSERLSRLESTRLQSPSVSDRDRMTLVEHENRRSSSLPPSSSDKKCRNKSPKSDKKTLLKPVDKFQDSRIRTEMKGSGDSLQSAKSMIQNSEVKDQPSDLSCNLQSKTKPEAVKVSPQKSSHMLNSSHLIRENEGIAYVPNIDNKGSDIIMNTRSMKYSLPSETPLSEASNSKSKSFSTETSRDKRCNSVEKDGRCKISHLVPRSPQACSAISDRGQHNSVTTPSITPPDERPRRKRKVPTRNMEAMELLSKIHNPDKDTLSPKRSCLPSEKDTNLPKPAKELKSQAVEIKMEDEHETEEGDSKDKQGKGIRHTRSRSRMFVLGRNNPRGRKLLRSYDKARVDKLIDIQNSKCLVCGEQCTQLFNLRRHIIRIHLQWSRYQCKLCRFSSFDRSECTTHIVRNHRRAVNTENVQAVNNCITDLAKQGSRAMNMKKRQTLQDKNRLQSKETNIYARPNVRKMPRLAERTLIHEKTDSSDSMSSPEKEISENASSSVINYRATKYQMKTEMTTHDVSDNSSKRSSLPFNISTRNSPRVFDTRPYKSSERSSCETQGEVIILHTRKGMYTKTVPLIPPREKSDCDDKETNSKCEKLGTMRDDKEALQKVSSNKIEHKHDLVSPASECKDLLDNSGKSHETLKTDRKQQACEEIQEMTVSELSSQQCEGNNSIHLDRQSDNHSHAEDLNVKAENRKTGEKVLTNGHSSSDSEPNQTSFKKVNKDLSASTNNAPTPTLVNDNKLSGIRDSSHIPKNLKINPSYVVIESTKFLRSGTVNIGPSSNPAAKGLHFSDNTSTNKSSCVTDKAVTVHIKSNSVGDSKDRCLSQPQNTFPDDMEDKDSSVSSFEPIPKEVSSTENN